ncbi:MAG TPA: 3-oxoacyl-[acyl-carrier-protein] synthase III C-terminal domain-containing protein [Polyangiaceae bacterium]|nr:3-oxoacyl-[acyl-carrier-protein] synthase III C-terminal domain-containing protein [Polyangiaceae bacterium]
MSLPELYVSTPGVTFPSTRIDNAEILRRVKENYRGEEGGWPTIESAIQHVFGLCKTQYRYLEGDENARVADYAVTASRQCLEANGVSVDEIDLLICGGIARQYFEPATAMEVAAKLGIKRTHAFDVTAACVGHLEAIQTAAAYLLLHEDYETALVCTSELTGHFLSYDVQTVRDLYMKSAGLTVGNAAACVLLRRHPWPAGCLRLLDIATYTAPDHWHLCQAPIDGTFMSSSVELMRLGKLIPPWLSMKLASLGWKPTDVDHFVFHQPSEIMVRKLLEDIGVAPEKGVYTHPIYGNTASASVAVTLKHLLGERPVKHGDKLVLGSAAAGFSMVFIAAEWCVSEGTAPRASVP